jgi:hypothetical protein
MSVDLDTVSGCEQNFGSNSFENERESQVSFHDKLFSNTHCKLHFSKQLSIAHNRTMMEKTVDAFFLNRMRNAEVADTEGSVSGGIQCDWGGQDGPQFSAYIEAEAHDDHGNYVEVSVEQSSNGTGSASVSGSHETK